MRRDCEREVRKWLQELPGRYYDLDVLADLFVRKFPRRAYNVKISELRELALRQNKLRRKAFVS